MNIVFLYLATALIFFVVDVVGLKLFIKPVFEQHVGHLFAEDFRLGAAGLFYLGYVAGIVWFVSLPAMRADDPSAALIGGILLGLMAYGTYEFTNYATLKDWTMQQVVLDTIWGAALTGVAAWGGVSMLRAIG
ncbi:MAG: DUF2177 family protein [Pseudomonadota bacterium]|jgi:uncharacterized membrane protein|uniref:DUF2177 family protein n=1 Tax=Thalassovita sp. TaxID=1979401 RepID=UPI002AB0AFAC|nr:DUF2177 family protein [Thalassovita sp.]MEC7964702.1 DUF2177 family protein [Pseudomonadota bacterium]MEC8293336.1 DUF2177 family protein [Pseudomonadota bacterium]|tara:strand:- start:506 stop:904 length:399 start_codon:yes stop_codon:yes gene_type:complete